MTKSEGIVDWNALSLNDGIRLLSKVMRQYLKVRTFVLANSGERIDLTPSQSEVKSVFDHFVKTDARWGDGEELATMVETERQWAQALAELCDGESRNHTEAAPLSSIETRPGFWAQLAPIYLNERVCAAVVVAGFVPTEKAAEAVESIRKVLPRHIASEIDGEGGPQIVQLPREERRWLDRLATSMAAQFSQVLQLQAPAVVDEEATRFEGMLGKSPGMMKLFKEIGKVARTDSTILITGENGTGKELVAQAIHRRSRRANQPFIAVNCAAIPGELIASELFGHVKGAFSGAHRDRKGLFEAADGGTLLLDEIGDMEHSLQTKLLRVLQEGTFLPVGDTEVRNVDVRVLCATNRDLEDMVRRGQFRRDLFFRVRVIQLSIPALRERGEDIELLARNFVNIAARRHDKKHKELSDQCLSHLRCYEWPGNVRELENEIERLVIMSGDEEILDGRWLSSRIAQAEESQPSMNFEGFELPEAIEIVERRMILDTLKRTGWNKSQTARELGVSRRNLIRKVARFELEEERDNE